jgi:nucleoside-diphosphate-sugar epimerase
VTVVLLTGGGFIGAQIVKALVERGDTVVIYDVAPDIRRLMGLGLKEDNIRIVRGDLLDLPYIVHTLRDYKVEKIIHTAAIGWRGETPKQPMRTLSVNVQGSANIFEAARIMGIKRVVNFSSYWVYGKTRYEPVDEDHPCNPLEGVYNVTKYMAERWGTLYHALYGLDIVSIRPSSVYGPYQPPGDEPLCVLVNAINRVATRWPRGRDHRFDPVCVFDVVQGALKALDVDSERLEHRVFNIAYGKPYTIGEIAEIVKKLIPEAEIEIGPGIVPEWDCATGQISIERARRELGYEPKYDPEQGFKLCIEYAQKNK